MVGNYIRKDQRVNPFNDLIYTILRSIVCDGKFFFKGGFM